MRKIQRADAELYQTFLPTDSADEPNFSLNGINQLWVGDITYIPLAERTFGYLAMLMDRFSRRLIGWHIDTTMTEALVIQGLRTAIAIRQPNKRLIHHTDRGGQYAGKQIR